MKNTILISTLILIQFRLVAQDPYFPGIWPELSDEDRQLIAKRDTAINAYNDGNWIKVISLYEEIEESNFNSHKLLIAASHSYKELALLGGNRSDEFSKKSGEADSLGIELYGEKLMKDGFDEVVYTIVDTSPRPSEGWKEFNRKLLMDLNYPQAAIEHKIQGRVFVQFIVNKDGTIGGPHVIKGLHPECDKEAVRLINETSNWVPGQKQGEAVYVKIAWPVSFNIKKFKKGLKQHHTKTRGN